MGVAVHEFGHALGLGHSSVEGSIMFPWYSKNTVYAELPEDDRIGIQEIYGQVNPHWRPVRPATTTTTTTTTARPTRTYYPYRYNPKDWPHSTRHPNANNHPHDRRPSDENNRPDERPFEPSRRPYHHHTTNRYPGTTASPPRRYPGTEVTHRKVHQPRQPKVDECNMDYDAISIIRGEMFIFKDQVRC